jgi:hypothetical protein
MRRLRRTLIISVSLLLLGAAPALAEVRSGEQSDPVGDATVGTGGFGTPDAQLLDVTYVSASYDSNTGTVNASFSGDIPNGMSGYTRYTITFGEPTSTGCGGASTDFTLKANVDSYDSMPMPAVIYPPVTFVGTVWANPFVNNTPLTVYPGLTYHAQGTSLMNRDFRCVLGVQADRTGRHGPGPSIDYVTPFCLRGPTVPAGNCFSAPAPLQQPFAIQLTADGRSAQVMPGTLPAGSDGIKWARSSVPSGGNDAEGFTITPTNGTFAGTAGKPYVGAIPTQGGQDLPGAVWFEPRLKTSQPASSGGSTGGGSSGSGSSSGNSGSASGSGTNVNVQVSNTIQVAGATVSAPLVLKISSANALRRLAGPGLSASLKCPSACTASGRLTRSGKTVATAATVHGKAGHRVTLRLKATKAQRRHIHAGTYTLRLTMTDTNGRKSNFSRTLKLR